MMEIDTSIELYQTINKDVVLMPEMYLFQHFGNTLMQK